MNKIIHEEKLLIREIKDLITPRLFYVQLYKDQGVVIEATWLSDTSIDTSELYFIKLDKWRMKKCLTLEQLNHKLRELESRIGSICRLCDTVAKNKGINKAEFFEGLLEEAKKREWLN